MFLSKVDIKFILNVKFTEIDANFGKNIPLPFKQL